MATMFQIALQRLANGHNGQVMPVKKAQQGIDGTSIQVLQGYELQWLERFGVDPDDTILCLYRVKDPTDVKRISDAFERRQTIQSLAVKR